MRLSISKSLSVYVLGVDGLVWWARRTGGGLGDQSALPWLSVAGCFLFFSQRFRVVFQRNKLPSSDEAGAGSGSAVVKVDTGGGLSIAVFDDWTQIHLDKIGQALFTAASEPTQVRHRVPSWCVLACPS